jgi:nitroimidazol reductase NimA-like FMN-containing flavoprotein (pyridoxamine 5'-phosphate oxidase superfamily)
MNKPGSTEKTKLNRISHKASDSISDLHSVLDDNLVAHVGIIFDGAPLVIPMAYGRIDNRLYLHGSSGSRLMRALTENPQVCVSITELNGIKVARSTFHTGMHYRSAVIFGRAELVSDADKNAAMDAISDSMIPGRMSEVRAHTKKELAATLIIWVDLNETSVKISNNPVADDEDDLGKGVWAGILPIVTSIGTPIPADAEAASLPLPQSIVNFRTGSSDSR